MPLGRIILYTKKRDDVAAFYCKYFGFSEVRQDGDRIVELIASNGGANIMLHPMSDGRKDGQTLVKLVFDVRDVDAFCQTAKDRGLTFGPIHRVDGYCFANAKDPAKNAISVSSRAFAPG